MGDVFLLLVDAYESLVSELSEVYYLQDSDKLRELREKVDLLTADAGIEWSDYEPRWVDDGS